MFRRCWSRRGSRLCLRGDEAADAGLFCAEQTETRFSGGSGGMGRGVCEQHAAMVRADRQPFRCQPQRLSQSLVATKQHPARKPDQAQPLTGLGHQNSEPLCKRDACGATTQPLDSLCQSQRCERCCRVVAGAVLRNTLQRCPARCPVKPKAKACAQDTVEGALAARAADDCLVGHASGHDQAKLQSRNREPREVGHFKSPARRGTQRSMPDVAFDTRPEC